MERALRNEAARKLLKQGVAQRWSAWVEGWLGVDFSRGSEVTVAAPALNVDPSGELKIPTVMSYVGPVRPGEFKLSARTKLQDDKLRALMSGVNAAFEAGVELTGVHGKAETLAEVETTWPELKPSWSHTRRFLELEVGGKLRREIEDHVYRFDWSSPGRGEPKCAPPSTLN